MSTTPHRRQLATDQRQEPAPDRYRTVDALVAGVGTGGTISGIGSRLREEFPEMEIVAVEPAENAVL